MLQKRLRCLLAGLLKVFVSLCKSMRSKPAKLIASNRRNRLHENNRKCLFPATVDNIYLNGENI